jgi:hypothetical protein
VIILLSLKGVVPSLPEKKLAQKKIIKSYLYNSSIDEIKIIKSKDIIDAQKTNSYIVKSTKVDKHELPKPETSQTITNNGPASNKIKNTLKSATTVSTSVSKKPEENSNKVIDFSAYEQLNKLKLSINNKVIKEALVESQRFESMSLMHAAPEPVPHSITKTESVLEGAKKMNMRTSHYGNTTVYKDNNGICTSVTDMSYLGLGPMKKTRIRRCSESKFDKTFRLHMKDVLRKLGK